MENKQIDILDAVEDSFKIYAGMTIKKRALIDVRDCLKPAARMCMYAQKLENIISSKPVIINFGIFEYTSCGNSSIFSIRFFFFIFYLSFP